jgi:hypothetical protein
MITALTIIETMKKWVEEKRPIDAATWLDASLKLNVLRGDLDDKSFELDSQLAKKKMELMSNSEITNAHAETIIRADDRYKEMKKTNAQIKQLEEFIRISKKQATMKNEEFINSR